MSVPICLDLPADATKLAVARDVVGTAFAASDRLSEGWDDLAVALNEVLFDLCAGPGVRRVSMTIEDASVVVEAVGDSPTWEPSPVADRLVPRLVVVESEPADEERVRLRLSPRRA